MMWANNIQIAKKWFHLKTELSFKMNSTVLQGLLNNTETNKRKIGNSWERSNCPSRNWNIMINDCMSAMKFALNTGIAIDCYEEVGDGGNEDDF